MRLATPDLHAPPHAQPPPPSTKVPSFTSAAAPFATLSPTLSATPSSTPTLSPPHALPNHLSADESRRIAAPAGQTLLLTIPESVGYEQKPLSLYYCYDDDQILKKCIAEVTNTPWGERVLFVFNPDSDLVAKPLHVSPFMDMLGDWSIKANAPDDVLSVSISVQHPELGNYFTATLKAKRVSSSSVSEHDVFFWLMPHKVVVWIYWHALKLWWKNVAFVQHPRSPTLHIGRTLWSV